MQARIERFFAIYTGVFLVILLIGLLLMALLIAIFVLVNGVMFLLENYLEPIRNISILAGCVGLISLVLYFTDVDKRFERQLARYDAWIENGSGKLHDWMAQK